MQTTKITIAVDALELALLKRLAREQSYKTGDDIGYADLIRSAIKRQYLSNVAPALILQAACEDE